MYATSKPSGVIFYHCLLACALIFHGLIIGEGMCSIGQGAWFYKPNVTQLIIFLWAATNSCVRLRVS